MLSEMYIENVAVIENAKVIFSPGLNILTGETGAGKSILIDSINAILGNRTSKEIIRTNSEKATIWAVFTCVNPETENIIKEVGYDCEDNLIIYRDINADGGSRFRINQKPATASTVRDICSRLINIHGQHDNQDLLNPERHILILDRFADITDEVANFSALYKESLLCMRKIEAIDTDDAQKERQADLLRYQIDEIDKANLVQGEDEELIIRRNIIRDSEKILLSLTTADRIFSGDGESPGLISGSYDLLSILEEISKYGEEYLKAYRLMDEQYYSLTDISENIKSIISLYEYNPEQLQDIEERLDLLYRLKRKYGTTIDEINKFQASAQSQLNSIETSEQQLEILRKEYSELTEKLDECASIISKKRIATFKVFETEIKSELSYLNMKDAIFEVHHELAGINQNGIDRVEFYISTNAGEPPKPLSRIASGGELSRIMLAIKNTMADKDYIETLIFDEIDTGISGTSAYKIGKKLKQSATSRQTICVTHSAQIASFADNHLYISKAVLDGRTFTSVTALGYEERKHELARIISGDNITETSLNNAGEMLHNADESIGRK